jgi:hypothetical protein
LYNSHCSHSCYTSLSPRGTSSHGRHLCLPTHRPFSTDYAQQITIGSPVTTAPQVHTRRWCQTSQRAVTCPCRLRSTAPAQHSPTSGVTSPAPAVLHGITQNGLSASRGTPLPLRTEGTLLSASHEEICARNAVLRASATELLLPRQKAFVPRLFNTCSLARHSTHLTFYYVQNIQSVAPDGLFSPLCIVL